jgi:hypothetical protein
MTPFAEHHMPDITRLRDKSLQMGDQLKPHRTNPDIMLVSAQSLSSDAARVWYKVNTRTGTCTCKGFARFANCRHLARTSYELHRIKAAA